MLSKEEARRWTQTGILAAFAIVLSYIETFIPLPIPLPGAKWGLANIAVLMALVLIDGRSAFAITAIKTLVTGLLFGSPLMIPYSAAGALLALGGMYGLLKVPGLHLLLISIVGALLHVAGQLAVAGLMLGTPLVWYSFPFLMLIACATGALTGKVAASLIRAVQSEGASSPLANAAKTSLNQQAPLPCSAPEMPPSKSRHTRFVCTSPKGALALLAACVAYFALVFCSKGTLMMAIVAAIALGCAALARITIKKALTALAPLGSILVITALAQILYVQQGTVLVELGDFALTQEALVGAATMMVRLVCVMLASIAFMRVTTTESLLGGLQQALAPLERMGLRTGGFMLSCHLALQFIPVLTSSFKQLRHLCAQQNPQFGTGSPLARLRDYQTLIPPLATAVFAYSEQSSEILAGQYVDAASIA